MPRRALLACEGFSSSGRGQAVSIRWSRGRCVKSSSNRRSPCAHSRVASISANAGASGTRLRNAFNKEIFVFSGPLDDPHVARFGVILETGGSGGGNALVHVHSGADEHFSVRSGRIKVVVDGREQFVDAGGTAIVPRGRPHYFANVGDDNAELEISFSPAQQHLR